MRADLSSVAFSSKLHHRITSCILSISLAIVFSAAGCQKVETRFDVLSFRKRGLPESFTEHFQPGSFTLNTQHNYEIVFRIPPTWISGQGSAKQATTKNSTTAPSQADAADSSTQDSASDGIWMSQIIHIEVFWQPRPGTTYAESTQTNASILYCLITGENAISYEGAGFVYFDRSRDGGTIEGQIESSTLFPARFTNAPVDLFGSCRLTGTFVAERNAREPALVQKELRRRLGPPVASDTHTPPS